MTSDNDLQRRFTLLAEWAEQQEPVLPLEIPRAVGRRAVGRRSPAHRPSLRLAPTAAAVLAAACVLLVWAVVALRPNGSPAPPSVATTVMPATASPTTSPSTAPAPTGPAPSGPAAVSVPGAQPSAHPRSTGPGTSGGRPSAGPPSGGAAGGTASPAPGASVVPGSTRAPTATVAPTGGSNPGNTQVPDTSTLPQGVSYALTAGARSTYVANSAYSTAVTDSRVVGNDLQVTFVATGGADLPRPEPTCLRVTTPGGTTLVRTPRSVDLTTNQSGRYAGTMTFPNLQPGGVTLQYACRADYSVASVGVIGRPAAGVFWALGGPPSTLSGPGLSATVTAASMANGVLSVGLDVTGLTALLQPVNACLKVTAPNGTVTTRVPDASDLTINLSTRAAGTLTWSGLPPGEITLSYACLTAFGTAYIGTLG